ncbi:MAG: hypothetical protein WAV55_00285 [Clostridiaceae bacterium]
MARRSTAIDEKISRQKEVVSLLKDKYEAALEELANLMKKKQELQGKELLNAFMSSDKSQNEILEFMKVKSEN